MSLPFTGLSVLDVTHVIAGAHAAYHFALLGADVLRVEPPGGDPLRARGGADAALAAAGLSTPFLAQAAGKRAIALDLRMPEGRNALLALATRADILIENYRPGALAALGLGADALRAANPRLIHCSISGYGGGEGPGDWRAYDHVIQAASGIMSMTGTEATGPLRAGPQIVDYATGSAAAFACAAALHRRAATGEGASISVSMLEVALGLCGAFVADHTATGALPGLRGQEAGSGSPLSGVFDTADGLLAIAASEAHQAARLFAALAIDDARFTDGAGRARHRVALRDAIATRLRDAPATAWETRLNTAGVPAARVRNLAEALALQAQTHRPFLRDATLPDGRALRLPGLPFTLDAAPAAPLTIPEKPIC